MPKSPPKPCNWYGCPELAEKDGFCAAHWTPRWTQYRRGPSFRDTAAWKKLRKAKLNHNPLCQCADADCHRPATVVHHIVPVEDGGAPFEWDNLSSRAWVCHEREHGRKK